MRTLFQTIKQQFLEGNDLVLASITASSGSTPRGAGSRMLIGKSGRIAGTIGGARRLTMSLPQNIQLQE